MSSYEEWVERVKELQRSNPEGKEQWITYTAEFGEGKRDPRAHDEIFIEAFFAAYECGTISSSNKRGDSNEVFVGGLPKDCTEEAVFDYFSTFAHVKKVEFKGDKGYCFVTFEDEYGVTTVLENDHHEINGKWVDCKRTHDSKKGKGKSGGKGKGYGGGRGSFGGKDNYGGGKDSYARGRNSGGYGKGGGGGYGKGGGGGYGKGGGGSGKWGKGKGRPY